MALAMVVSAMPAPAASIAYRVAIALPGEPPVSLHVEEHGAGPPILLLHGIGGSGFTFRHLIAPLARSHRVITLDLKGFGASDKPLDDRYGPDDQARLVKAFIAQRRLTGLTLGGHSFGAAVALLVALDVSRREPHRIRRLVLMNVPAYPQPLPGSHRLLAAPILPHLALAVVPPIFTTRAALQSKRRSAPPATDAEAGVYAEPLYDIGGRHALIATSRAMAEINDRQLVPAYGRLRMPALLIWCRHDQVVPLASGQKLAAALPRAKLDVIDACGHKPAEEAPAETLRAMLPFLTKP